MKKKRPNFNNFNQAYRFQALTLLLTLERRISSLGLKLPKINPSTKGTSLTITLAITITSSSAVEVNIDSKAVVEIFFLQVLTVLLTTDFLGTELNQLNESTSTKLDVNV